MTAVANAVSELFRRHGAFIVVGLTGRTGSGCTTSADLLSLPLTGLPLRQVAAPLKTAEDRKYRIVYEYAKENWQPFTVISVTQAIASFIFDDDPDAVNTFFRQAIRSAENQKKFLDEIDRIRPLWNNVKAAIAAEPHNDVEVDRRFFQVWNEEIKTFLRVARTTLASNFPQVFQTMGDNIRLSGSIHSNTVLENRFYSLPFRVSQIAVAARRINSHEKQPTRIALDALRNPFEIQFYRERFAGFYLIAVTTPDKDRKSRLYASGLDNGEIKKLDDKEYPRENKPLAGYAHFVSQNIQACLEKADIFIHNPGESAEGKNRDLRGLAQQLLTFTTLMQHPGLITPTRIERCMQIAYSANANSSCISRQVGAVITDGQYSIKAVGWNDVPAGQTPCLLRTASDLLNRSDEDAFSTYEWNNESFHKQVNSRYQTFALVPTEGRTSAYCFKSEYTSIDPKNRGNQVHTRSLHAEENAFLQIAKYGGQAVQGGILFSTASPCELCSKKAFQLGITTIYYIDPYPGIALDHILLAGKAEMRPKIYLFEGAVGQAFNRLYDRLLPYKDELESFISMAGARAGPARPVHAVEQRSTAAPTPTSLPLGLSVPGPRGIPPEAPAHDDHGEAQRNVTSEGEPKS